MTLQEIVDRSMKIDRQFPHTYPMGQLVADLAGLVVELQARVVKLEAAAKEKQNR